MKLFFTYEQYFCFSVCSGATLSKGLNRSFATLLAGALGIGANHLASLFGEQGEPIILGVLVFLLGTYIFTHPNKNQY